MKTPFLTLLALLFCCIYHVQALAQRLDPFAPTPLNFTEVLYPKCADFDLSRMGHAFGTEALPGAALLVDSPTRKCQSAIGKANLLSQEPMTTDFHFLIASNTKMFTAATVLKMIEDGTLTLDPALGLRSLAAPLLSVEIQELTSKIPNFEKVTLLDLLRHTSGIESFATEGSDFEKYMFAHPDDPSIYESKFVLRFSFDHHVFDANRVKFEPGKGSSYSNTNYLLLSEIIKNKSGLTLAGAYQKYIYRPLQLQHTYIINQEAKIGRTPTPYHLFEGQNKSKDVSEIYVGFTGTGEDGLVSSLTDLNHFIRAYAKAEIFSDWTTGDFYENRYQGPEFDSSKKTRSKMSVGIFVSKLGVEGGK